MSLFELTQLIPLSDGPYKVLCRIEVEVVNIPG